MLMGLVLDMYMVTPNYQGPDVLVDLYGESKQRRLLGVSIAAAWVREDVVRGRFSLHCFLFD